MSSFMFNFCFVVSWIRIYPNWFLILPSCAFHLPPFQRASLLIRCRDGLESSEVLVVLLWVLGVSPLQDYLLDSLVFELIVTVGKEVEKETLKGNHKTFA